MSQPVKSSISATLAALFGVLAVLAVILGPLGIHLGLFSPIGGFRLFGPGMIIGGLLALLVGIVGLMRTRAASGRTGRRNAWIGIVLGGALILWLVFLIFQATRVPPIHDITTNPDDPPKFGEALKHPDNQGRDLTYPHGHAETAQMQREAYPDLQPIRLAMPPDQAFEAARRAAEKLGWTITRLDTDAGEIEAYDVTSVFKFVDDQVIRVRPAADGSVIDIRSTSREGESDIGKNAERIRAFIAALRASS
jgi:uncharacterized protein (DUF1499 family)